ncbi:hypothetical protein [Phenylobacterium sp.]|uniref:hypothetical protein n=1 Tax=Phenylobacterium sp. TaxID=1871053 RepID=UPI00403638F0
MSAPHHPPSGRITAAEYGRRNNIGKSGMSRLIKDGLPFVEGQDADGRKCKFVDPDEADRWRATHCTPKLFAATGVLRGVPNLGDRTSAQTRGAPAPSPPGQAGRIQPRTGSGGGGDGGADDGLNVALRIQDARARREEIITATQALRLEALEGKLLDRVAALTAHERFVGQVAVLIDRMAADHASRIASKLGCSEHAAFVVLRDMGDRLRGDLAAYAERELERLVPDDGREPSAA